MGDKAAIISTHPLAANQEEQGRETDRKREREVEGYLSNVPILSIEPYKATASLNAARTGFDPTSPPST